MLGVRAGYYRVLLGEAINLWLLLVETLCSSVDRDHVLGRAPNGSRGGPMPGRETGLGMESWNV